MLIKQRLPGGKPIRILGKGGGGGRVKQAGREERLGRGRPRNWPA